MVYLDPERYLDPSYGVEYDSIQDMENDVIAGHYGDPITPIVNGVKKRYMEFSPKSEIHELTGESFNY